MKKPDYSDKVWCRGVVRSLENKYNTAVLINTAHPQKDWLLKDEKILVNEKRVAKCAAYCFLRYKPFI